MPRKTTKQASYLLITILLTLGLSISLQSLLAAWTAPTSAPPQDNVGPPIYNEHTTPTTSGLIDLPLGLGLSGAITINQYWPTPQSITINSNQIWKTNVTGDKNLYLQWSNVGGAVQIGSSTGVNNNLNVYGNVGFGASAANKRLLVADPSNDSQAIFFKTSAANAYLEIGANDSVASLQGYQWSGTPGPVNLVMQTAGGNVGIGKTPAAGIGLDVSGVIQASGDVCIDGGNCLSTDNVGITFWAANGTDPSKIYYNGGNVGIGTDDPGAKLDVSGDIKTSGKIKSAETADSDSDDTVVTKSYVDDNFSFVNGCGWRSTETCNNDEVMKGYKNFEDQIYCCGANPSTCAFVDWHEVSRTACSASCPACSTNKTYPPGIQDVTYQRTLTDCGTESSITTGVACIRTCPATCFGSNICVGSSCEAPVQATTPYLFTYSEGGYYLENDIMNTYAQYPGYSINEIKNAYESGERGSDWLPQDIYKLARTPEVSKDQEILLKIREIEPEESMIDQVELLKVIHDQDSVAITDNYDIYGAQLNEILPDSCVDENGEDCLEPLLYNDANAIGKGEEGQMIVTFQFDEVPQNAYINVTTWENGYYPSPIKSPYEDGYSYSLIFYSYYKDGEWKQVGKHFHPRSIRSTEFEIINMDYKDEMFDFAEMLDDDKRLTLKIDWTAKHTLDKIAMATIDRQPVRTESLAFKRAEHSRDGDVFSNMTEKDLKYAHIVRGDTIDLAFEAGELWPEENETVDYFFIIKGYYHGLRTYLYPEVDPGNNFHAEVNGYIKELNDHLKTKGIRGYDNIKKYDEPWTVNSREMRVYRGD